MRELKKVIKEVERMFYLVQHYMTKLITIARLNWIKHMWMLTVELIDL